MKSNQETDEEVEEVIGYQKGSLDGTILDLGGKWGLRKDGTMKHVSNPCGSKFCICKSL